MGTPHRKICRQVWTDQSVAQLRTLIEAHGRDWKKIAKAMGRSFDSVAGKARDLRI
jgi:hypothetical protein